MLSGPGLDELVCATKRIGHIIVCGYLGAMEDATPLPLGACFLLGLNLHTSYGIFDFTGHPRLGTPPNRRAIERAKKFIFDGLASELFKPKVDRVFVGLEDYVLAVSQNQPVMVGIKGVKTSHFMERKTAPRDYCEAVPMERVQPPQSELANNDLQFSRPRMVPAAYSQGTWDQSRNGWSVFAVGKTSHYDRRV
jgi:hypothetical protein